MSSLRDEIGDFVGIPISFVEDGQQTAESRLVFMILRYHTNRKSKRAFPGYETIMRETGLSRQKTATGIAVLVVTGWLVKHKLFARKTEYELRYPVAALSSTGELTQSPTLVPQGNVVSSTMEQPPLDNKIDLPRLSENEAPDYRKTEAGKRSVTLSARSSPTRIDSRPKKIPVPDSPDSNSVKAFNAWGAKMGFEREEMVAMWGAFRLKHLDEKTPPQTEAEWGIKFQRYVANCNVNKVQRQRPA